MPNKHLREVMHAMYGSFKIARARLWLKGEGKCWLCGLPVDIDETTFDHVIPTSKGGTHTWNNLMPAHRVCNVERGNLPKT